MKLEVLNEKEYDEFALQYKNISIYGLANWGTLKMSTGWKRHLVGYKNNGKIICEAMLLEKNTPVKKSLYYCPRGFLIDYDNHDLLDKFSKDVIQYVKKHNGFCLKIDPNVIHKIRDDEYNDIEVLGDEIHEKLVLLGYKHYGFTNDFETLQPRCLCGFKLQDSYEKTLSSFQKTARKNIEKTIEMGVNTRKIDENDIDEFMRLLNLAGDTHDFVIRPKWYYEKMYDLFKKQIKYYITSLDTKIYKNYLQTQINSFKNELEELEVKFEKYNVGDKLKYQKENAETQLKKYHDEYNRAMEQYKDDEIINIGALMSLFIGHEAITFMSGTDPKYKNFYPKYSYYNQHIKDAIEEHKDFINFYGISGNTTKGSKYYSIYEIKKGFNPVIIELIGEYDYIINKPFYHLYNIALFSYKILKKIKTVTKK